MMRFVIALCLAIGLPLVVVAETTALVGATIHQVTGPTIDNATIVFDESGILAIGTKAKIPNDAKRVESRSLHVYPGLISAYSQIGLVEIDAVRATVDLQEAGEFNPNAIAHKALSNDSELIPVVRSNGILLSLMAPQSKRIGGQSSLVKFSGWTAEQMIHTPNIAMHIRWPRSKDDDSELRELTEFFAEAKSYHAARAADDARFDIRLEAMGPLLAGKQLLVVEANRAAEINSAVAFAQQLGLRLVIYSGYEAPECARLLKQFDVPVIVSAIYRLPNNPDDAYDDAYTLPARLQQAGVKYCIGGAGDTPSNLRNLPYHAATAAAFGISPDEALKGITLYPAQILGVADRLGSLQVGKDATLFVADGDILEIPTQVLSAYVDGRVVDLDDRHKRLYRKFRVRK